jgi:endoplasmic reticulum chaperone BiP
VLATNGDTHLGGEDFDQRIMDHFIRLVKRKHGRDISRDGRALGKLRRECERVMSSQHQVRVEVEALFDGVNFSESLTRARFEELNSDLFRKTMVPVKKAMQTPGSARATLMRSCSSAASPGFIRSGSSSRSTSTVRSPTWLTIS